MSSDDNPGADGPNPLEALAELEVVLASLRDGVADWRRRALKAEAEQTGLTGGDAVRTRERMRRLESDNADLRLRLDAARARVEELLARMRFLEEQMALEEQA